MMMIYTSLSPMRNTHMHASINKTNCFWDFWQQQIAALTDYQHAQQPHVQRATPASNGGL